MLEPGGYTCLVTIYSTLYNKLSYARILIGSHLRSMEDRHIDDVIIKTFLNSLLYKTNRFQVAVHLFSNRSQRTSKCGKNISDTLSCASCATVARQLGIYLLNRLCVKLEA